MRVTRVMYAVIGAALAATLASPPSASAQGWLKRIKDEAKAKVQQRTDQATDSVTDAAFNKAEHVVKCLGSNLACIKKAADAGQAVQVVNAQGQAVSTADSAQAMAAAGVAVTQSAATATSGGAAAAATAPGAGAWLNYDFIPGDRTIWLEDFSGDAVGDFPRALKLIDGNSEVVNIQGVPMLRVPTTLEMYALLPEKLPPRFTVEVKYHGTSAGGNPIKFATTRAGQSATFGCYANEAWVEGEGTGPSSGENFQSSAPDGFVDCRFTVDNGRGIKGYVNEHRTANAPGVHVALTDTLFIDVPRSSADDPNLVAQIRVAEGGKKLYDVLATDGHVSTQGILFDTGSEQIRPESTPTLVEIGQMLQQHPDLKLEIQGHTDNVGNAASNLALSNQRASAVMQYLLTTYQIDPSRLTAKGYGDTKPVAPNTTPEGRQMNRRVELVKM